MLKLDIAPLNIYNNYFFFKQVLAAKKSSDIYTKFNLYVNKNNMYKEKQTMCFKDHQIKLKGLSINDCMVEIDVKKASLFWKKAMYLS